mmetsp:Transcript_11657/g.26004  ORF Transcript_11657/g.26004 Transcript_11657/m.26004 type:complete len:219 (+) Transcript_11657:1005-1661(+)
MPSDRDDVWSVPPPRTLCVVGVDGAALEGGDCALHAAGFVKRVGVDCHLHILSISNPQTGVNRSRRGAPVLMQLQTHRPRLHDVYQTLRCGGVPLACEGKVHGVAVSGLQHHQHVVGRGRAGGGAGAAGGARAAAQHGGQAGAQGFVADLRADEVHVAVETACGNYHTLARNRFRVHAAHHSWGDSVHHIGISCLADARNASVLYANIGLVNASHVHD